MSEKNDRSQYIDRHELAAETDEKFEDTANRPFIPEFMINLRRLAPRKRWFASREVLEGVCESLRGVVPVEHNFYRNEPSGDGGAESAKLNFRMAGFLHAMLERPELSRRLQRLIKKAYSGRGINSPASSQKFIWDVNSGCGSPEVADKQLRKAERRANLILAPYGVRVSNLALQKCLAKRSRGHKAGKRAAMLTLQQVLESAFGVRVELKRTLYVARGLAEAFREEKVVQVWAGSRIQAGEFSSLREAIEQKARLVADTTDEVGLMLDSASLKTLHGATVAIGYKVPGGQYEHCEKTMIVKRGNRSFHHDYVTWEYDRESRAHLQADPYRVALKWAVKSWKEQDKSQVLAKAEFALPDNLSLLVYKSDSYAVGNCRPGTEAFMRRIGVRVDTCFAGGHMLLPFLSTEPRAKATFGYAVRQLREQLTGNKTVAA